MMGTTGDMSESDPFSIRRWEFESDHVVWAPPMAKQVTGEAPCHIQGVRGTGKTALLRIADYYTRRSGNIEIFNHENVNNKCLGIYLNFLDEFTEFLDDPEYPDLYYDYVYCYCISKVLDLLDDASRDGLLFYSESDERAFCATLVKDFDFQTSKFEAIDNFVAGASYLRRHCRTLRQEAIGIGFNKNLPRQIISGVELYDFFCRKLNEYQMLKTPSGHFFVKICVDDAHLSGLAAQRRLNNILARSQSPIFWNIAYVEGQFDPYDIDSRTKYVTSHDREFIDLNYRDHYQDFQEICRKVFELRASKFIGDSAKFDVLESMTSLGNYVTRVSYEDSFLRLFNRSKKLALKDRISAFSTTLGATHHKKLGTQLYYAFIATCLFESTDELETFLSPRTPEQVDNYFRQKGSAALVVAAKQFELAVPYEGLNALFYLSDGCLRDFLSLCSKLFSEKVQRASSGKGSYFDGNTISMDVQTRAFRESARLFLLGIHNPRQPYAKQLSQLVRGFGELTSLLQCGDPKNACSLPDRGLFKIDFERAQRRLFVDEPTNYESNLRDVLKEGVYTGVIRLEQGNFSESTTVEFRLSGILAPEFQTSARKPKRSLTLDASTVVSLMGARDPFEVSKWAQSQYIALRNLNRPHQDDVDLDERLL